MNVTEIKKHVTHFSEQLRDLEQEAMVTVGGTITHIVAPVDEEYPLYVVILDDKVGTIHTVVPDSMMDAYPEQFKVGQTIFIEGFVNIITRQIRKEKKKDVSIFAFSMKDITLIGDTNK